MKLKSLLLFPAVALGLQVSAQTWVVDSVQMGPNYGNDVYYSLKNDSVGAAVNTNWHLGFEMVPGGPGFGGVSIIANHVQGAVKAYSLHKTASSFNSLTFPADTLTRTALNNSDSSWDWGALNVNASGNVFDYGWGQYNSTTHYVEGDSLYMLSVGNGPSTKYYKMTISHYHSFPLTDIYYAFRIAELDGSNEILDTVRRMGYENKNFAYYNITTNSVLNREPDRKTWDVLFTRYTEYIAMGPGPKVAYPVAGVLSNIGVMVAEARKMDADTVKYPWRTFNKNMSEIGSDWKVFNNTTFQYEYDTVSYFVKTIVDTAVYQIKFSKFESGSGPAGTGKFVFAKRMVSFPASVGNLSKHIARHSIVPNPASSETSLVLESNEAVATARFTVTDITGKVIVNTTTSLQKGLNALQVNTSNYTAGTYFVTISNGAWTVTEKLVVQH